MEEIFSMSNFDVKKTTEDVVKWIQEFFEKNGKGCNAVIGISGGKDSSVVAGLCVKALGKDRVIGVLMPNGQQSDIDMAFKLVNHLGIRAIEVNIADAVQGILNGIENAKSYNGYDNAGISNQAKINLPPRIRMSTVYAISQCNNGRVANTCNLSEDWVGYSTRYGDSAGDFSPLAKLTVDEVKQIGREIGLPAELVDKVPSDGLCGKTDEDNLGFTYAELDKYIRTGICDNPETKALIDQKHERNKFKLELMPCFEYEA